MGQQKIEIHFKFGRIISKINFALRNLGKENFQISHFLYQFLHGYFINYFFQILIIFL